MRLVTYRAHVNAAARLGAIVGDLVIDLQRLGSHAGQALPADILDFIDLGPHAVTSTNYRHDPPTARIRARIPVPRGQSPGTRRDDAGGGM